MVIRSNEQSLWRQDRGLATLLSGESVLFSFDLFDTLLIRLDRTCNDVFVETGKRAVREGLLDRRISPDLFARMRIAAGQKSEIEIGATYTLHDIYRRMPVEPATVDVWVALEIAVEAEGLRVDPYIDSFVRHLGGIGRPVIAVSEMYLPAESIAELIRRAGGDPDIFQRIYVSCDIGKSKRDGGLFRRVLADYPDIPSSRICHIGDDPIADNIAPRKLGIHTCTYDFSASFATLARREAEFRGIFMNSPEWSARRLAARQLRTFEGDQRFWREFGATVLGPVMLGYAAYVVETCRQLGISRIAALMREGRLLAKLLSRYAELRGYQMDIAPLAVSRLALARTRPATWDGEALRDALRQRPHLRVGDILAEAPPDVSPPLALAALADWHIEELANLPFPGADGGAGQTMLDALTAWFQQPDVSTATAMMAERARKNAVQFLEQAFADAPSVALVDLGARATIAAAVHGLDEIRQHTDLTAFLLYGVDEVTERTASGLPVMIYAGTNASAFAAGRSIYRSPYVIERLLTGLDDTTVSYAVDDADNIVPVTARTAASGEERAWIADAEAGVMLYWECWSRLDGGRGNLPNLSARAWYDAGDCVLLPWLRTLLAPTSEEARRLGALRYDYNDGSGWVRSICDDGAVDTVRPLLEEAGTVTAKLLGLRPQQVPWPLGAATIVDPGVLRRCRDAIAFERSHDAACQELIDRIGRSNLKAIIVYAAGGPGGMGGACVQAAHETGIEVVAYIDHLPQTVGDDFLGISVIPLGKVNDFPDIPVAIVTLGYHDVMIAGLEACGATTRRRIFSLRDMPDVSPGES